MTAKELIKKAEANGWIEVRQTGSHRVLKKEGVRALISIPDHGSQDLKKGLLIKLLKIIDS